MSKMAMEIIYTDRAPKPFAGYSQAVKTGGFVFVAGQPPFGSIIGEVPGDTVQRQTEQCLKNIEAILRAAGSSLDKVVSATFTAMTPMTCGHERRVAEVVSAGVAHRLHWSLPDPSQTDGDNGRRMGAFRAVRDRLKSLLEDFARSVLNKPSNSN